MRHIHLPIIFLLMLALAVPALAGALPEKSFIRNIERALNKERWRKPDEAAPLWRAALAEGKALIRARPDHVAYLLGTARCRLAVGDAAGAVALYETADRTLAYRGMQDPARGWPWAWVSYGLARAALGDGPGTVAVWSRVSPSIGTAYAAIRAQLGAMGQNPDGAALRKAADAVAAAVREASVRADQNGQPTLRQIGGVQSGAGYDDAHERRSKQGKGASRW